ncbi:MAG: hypothetical protein ED557_04120 [Balneola sp.]|nr:MAG: hypothetical protein ED557_04120 [Balneola sp.]
MDTFRPRIFVRFVMTSFWILFGIYVFIKFPNLWYDPSYSKSGLILVVVIPSFLLVVLGFAFSFKNKLIVTNEFIEFKRIRSLKIYYKEFTRVEVGSNFIKIYGPKRKSIAIGWIFQDYEKIKEKILRAMESFPEVKIISKERYRDNLPTFPT